MFGGKYRKIYYFSVPIKKQITKIDKDDNDKIVNILYKIPCQVHYKFLLIIYLKDFIMISAQTVNLVLTIYHSMMNNRIALN